MKIAAYVHPVVQSLGPNFSCGWFQILAKLLQTLRRDAACDCMIIAGEWPYRWAMQNGQQHLVEGLRIAALDEITLYRRLSATGRLPTMVDQLAYREGQQNHAALQVLTKEVERCAGDFQPDVVISYAISNRFFIRLVAECVAAACRDWSLFEKSVPLQPLLRSPRHVCPFNYRQSGQPAAYACRNV